MKISRGKVTGVAMVCIALLMACTTGKKKDRDPAGASPESGNAIRDAISARSSGASGLEALNELLNPPPRENEEEATFQPPPMPPGAQNPEDFLAKKRERIQRYPEKNQHRAWQYEGMNTADSHAMQSPPPPQAGEQGAFQPPPMPAGLPGPTEPVIPLQISRMKARQSFFDDEARIFGKNGGRVSTGGANIAGFWQMPPLPEDNITIADEQGVRRTVPMKMGAIQAAVLPTGKVIMVSGSSNRGDNRATKDPEITSQSYGVIDNTELFDPALVPTVEDFENRRVDAVGFEFPGLTGGARLGGKAESLAKARPTLYERPYSLPPRQAYQPAIHDKDEDFGTLRDPKFCAKERVGKKIFNNGISDLGDPKVYCEKIKDARLGPGRELPPVLLENASPNPTTPNIDLFCGGNLPLANGNVLFAGGTRKAVSFTEDFTPIPFHGVKRTLEFDWRQQQWRDAGKNGTEANMGDGRWYPTLVELPDGKVFIIGGMNHRGEISHTLEIFDPKTRRMSELVDFRPLGGTPMPFEPFSVFDPEAGRRFDNFPRVFLTHLAPQIPGCNDSEKCVRLMITGDGSAEGNRSPKMNRTLYVDIDTRDFPNLTGRVRFVPGPIRNIRDPRAPQTHEYTTHLYPTQLFDPTKEDGDYIIVGGSVDKYDPLHIAQDGSPGTVNPDTSTNFNSKPDHRTVSDMESVDFDVKTNSARFTPVFENFLGNDGDLTSRVGTSRVFPTARRQADKTVPCDANQSKQGNNVCGPINRSGIINPNAVVLPTRQFLVMGGGNHSYSDPVFNPILFTPAQDPFLVNEEMKKRLNTNDPTNTKRVGWGGEWIRQFMNPHHLPRLYHNTALLLPDGRVFMGSGNTFISFLKGVDDQGLPIVGSKGGQANNYNNFHGAANISGWSPIKDPATGENLSWLSVDLPAEQYQVELFNPPYLFFPGPRPVIQGIRVKDRPQATLHALPCLVDQSPSSECRSYKRWIDPDHEDILGYGSEVDLAIKNIAPGSKGRVTLIRLGGVTHAINFSQKLVNLHMSVNKETNPNDGGIVVASGTEGTTPLVTVMAPKDARTAPPGYYMLFFVNDRGKPSEARVVRLCKTVSNGSGMGCETDGVN